MISSIRFAVDFDQWVWNWIDLVGICVCHHVSLWCFGVLWSRTHTYVIMCIYIYIYYTSIHTFVLIYIYTHWYLYISIYTYACKYITYIIFYNYATHLNYNKLTAMSLTSFHSGLERLGTHPLCVAGTGHGMDVGVIKGDAVKPPSHRTK